MKIRLINHSGESMHVTPGTKDAQVFLSIHMAQFGIRAELVPDESPAGKYGLASGRRMHAQPERTSMGETLFGEATRLASIAARKTEG